jgi:hypothetical protein
MAVNKTTAVPGEVVVKEADVRGQHTTRLAVVIGGSVVLAILAIGVVVAIARDKKDRDYVSVLLPVITGGLLGAGGYFAGRKAGTD